MTHRADKKISWIFDQKLGEKYYNWKFPILFNQKKEQNSVKKINSLIMINILGFFLRPDFD